MIYELNKKDYDKAKHLFTKLKTNTAIESIFNYKNEARLFVDNPDEPKSLFILIPGHTTIWQEMPTIKLSMLP